MKIALIVDRIYPLYTGGYEYYLYKIANNLSAHHEVVVFTSISSKLSPCIGCNFKLVKFFHFKNYTNKEGGHSFSGILKYFSSVVLRYRLARNFDLVMINSIPYFGVSYLISRLKKKSRIVVTFYEAWYHYPKGGIIRNIQRFAIRRSIRKIVRLTDLIFSISNSTTESLLNNYRAKKVITVPLGVDLTFIEQIKPSTEQFDIAYLGRIAAIKHIEHLIEALYILKEEGIPIKAVIIGDGSLKQDLVQLTEKRGLENAVKFTGNVSEQEKISILKSSRLFVMPSEREGFSLATLEAMACGCVPVVAEPNDFELFGISQFVRNGENGLYFPLANIDILASEIRKLILDTTLYLKLQNKAIEESRKYDWNLCLGVIEKTLNGLKA